MISTRILFFAFSVLLSFCEAGEANKTCKALSLSGGGSRGAFEAGVLWGLYHTDPDKTAYAYDVVSGVSAGAINAFQISLFAKGDEEALVQRMSENW
jgi:NTE family protein